MSDDHRTSSSSSVPYCYGDIECCLPPAVEARTVNSKDRRAYATRDVQAGEVILTNMPLCYVVHDREERCSTCLISNKQQQQQQRQKLSRCSRCQQVWYCSKDCQKQDFPLHKVECREAQLVLRGEDPRGNAALLIRTFLALRLQEKKEEDCCCKQERGITSCGKLHFDNLIPSKSMTLSQEDRRDILIASQAIRNQAKVLAKSLDCSTILNKNIEELQHEMEHQLRVFHANNFGIIDSLVRVIAAGVYPLGALLNHSCAPNCLLRYNNINNNNNNNKTTGPVMEIVAACNIAKGDELTHSYVELVAPTVQRQERIRNVYGFECTCPRCLGEVKVSLPHHYVTLSSEPMQLTEWILQQYNPLCASSVTEGENVLVNIGIDELITARPADARTIALAENKKEQAKLSMTNEDVEGELKCLEDAVQMLEKAMTKSCTPLAMELYSARCDYLGTLIVAGRMKEALAECKHIVANLCISLHHVPNHPLLGLQLFTLGDLYEAHGDTENANSTYRWASLILQTSQGPNSDLLQLLGEKGIAT